MLKTRNYFESLNEFLKIKLQFWRSKLPPEWVLSREVQTLWEAIIVGLNHQKGFYQKQSGALAVKVHLSSQYQTSRMVVTQKDDNDYGFPSGNTHLHTLREAQRPARIPSPVPNL
eukprot:Platyproteum_vivax@DN7602_c0_g1_i1.p1